MKYTEHNIKDIKYKVLGLVDDLKPIDKGTVSNNLKDLDNNKALFYAKSLLSKILNQYSALTYDGNPDYEIHIDENENLDINELSKEFDDNYPDIDSQLKKVIKDYFLNGFACLLLNYGSSKLERIEPSSIYAVKNNENIFAVEKELEQEEVDTLVNKYSINISAKTKIKYIYYNEQNNDIGYKFAYIQDIENKDEELYFITETGNIKQNCIIETRDYSELYKISKYLESYNNINENYEKAIQKIKLLLLVNPAIKKSKMLEAIQFQDDCIVSIPSAASIDAPIDNQFKWLPNEAVAQTAEIMNSVQNILEAKIHEIVGFNDIYGRDGIEDKEETRIGASNRVNANIALWKEKQSNILMFFNLSINKWFQYLIKSYVTITIGATNLLEKAQKEHEKQSGIANLLSFIDKAITLPSKELIEFQMEAGLSITSNSDIPKSFIDKFTSVMEFLSKTAEQNSQQSSGTAQANAQLQAQAQQLEIQEKQTDITKKQADISKIGAEVQKLNAEAQAVPSVIAAREKEAEAKYLSAQEREEAEKRIETERGVHIENGATAIDATEQVIPEQTEDDTTHEVSQSGGILNRIKQLFTRFRGRS